MLVSGGKGTEFFEKSRVKMFICFYLRIFEKKVVLLRLEINFKVEL